MQMGMQRIPPAAVAAGVKGLRRLFVGAGVNYRGPQYGSPLVTAEIVSYIGTPKFSFRRYHNANLSGEDNRNLASQLENEAEIRMRSMLFESSECIAMCDTRILKDQYDRGVLSVGCLVCRKAYLIANYLGLEYKKPKFLRKGPGKI